jgi:hypothetical protein
MNSQRVDGIEGLNVPVKNNLKFLRAEYRHCMGEWYAFVTCIDVRADGKGTGKKYYWGVVAERDDPDELLNVMFYGDKWDKLPICS